MKYEDAVKIWGAKRLAFRYGIKIENLDLERIKVEFDFDEGNPCCGGTDPDCYCSLAESPSADVVISGCRTGNRSHRVEVRIPSYTFDFTEIVREICEAGEGKVTL